MKKIVVLALGNLFGGFTDCLKITDRLSYSFLILFGCLFVERVGKIERSTSCTLTASPLSGNVITRPKTVMVNIPSPLARAFAASSLKNLRGAANFVHITLLDIPARSCALFAYVSAMHCKRLRMIF